VDEAERLRRQLAARERELAEVRDALRIARLAAVEAETELADVRATLRRLSVAAAGPNTHRKRPARPTGRRPRRLPDLPAGVFEHSPEGHRSLVTSSGNLLVVDGYNLARAAWAHLAPEEERARTIALLEELASRSRGRVVVVFDGSSSEQGPAASRSVTVRFSATGQTADDLVVDVVAGQPPAQPVVVVSSDRGLGDDARRHGAAIVTSQEFLAVVGR